MNSNPRKTERGISLPYARVDKNARVNGGGITKKMVPAFIKLPPESVVRMPPNSPNVMEALEAFTIFPPFISCAPSPSLWINP
jgi:hypothetical protein